MRKITTIMLLLCSLVSWAQSFDYLVMQIENYLSVFESSRKTEQDVINLYNGVKSVTQPNKEQFTDPEYCFNLYKFFNDISNTFTRIANSKVNINNPMATMNALNYVGVVGEASGLGGYFLGRAADMGHPQALAICRSQLNGMTPGYNVGNINNGQQNNQRRTTTNTKKCTMCGGKGWIIGNKTPTFGNTNQVHCNECNGWYPASHSHDECPSCRGRGVIPTVGR